MHACFVHCSSQYYLNLIWKSSFNPSQLLIISPLNSLYCLMYIEEQHGWLFHWVKMVKIKGHLWFEGGKFTIWYSELPCSTLLDCKVNSCNPYTSLFVCGDNSFTTRYIQCIYHLSLDPYYLLSYTNTFRYSHAFRAQCFCHSWPYRYYSRFRSTFSCNFLWSWQPLFCSFFIPLTSVHYDTMKS